MLNDEEATRAIRELNGAVLNGNRLNVEVCTMCFVVKLHQIFVKSATCNFLVIWILILL